MDMQKKVVVDLVEVALKTCNRPALEDRCIKALSKLETLPFQNDVFASTKIGNIIQSMKSNPHLKPIVRAHASSLITKWKRQLYSRSPDIDDNQPSRKIPKTQSQKSHVLKTSTTVNVPSPKTNSTAPKVVVGSQSTTLKKKLMRTTTKPSSAAANPIMKKKQPLPQQKQAPTMVKKTDDVVDSIRNNIRQQIFVGLDMVLKERHIPNTTSGCYDPVGVAMSIETLLFHEWGTSNYKYQSFLYNLKDPKNPDFRSRILMGEVKQEKIAQLTSEDMASNLRRNLIDNVRETALNKCIVGRGSI